MLGLVERHSTLRQTPVELDMCNKVSTHSTFKVLWKQSVAEYFSK